MAAAIFECEQGACNRIMPGGPIRLQATPLTAKRALSYRMMRHRADCGVAEPGKALPGIPPGSAPTTRPHGAITICNLIF